MSLYLQGKRHIFRMSIATLFAVAFVIVIDRIYGHSSIAFAAAIFALIWINMPMLRINCSRCGHNVFFRGFILLPWPRKSCGKCGLDLTEN